MILDANHGKTGGESGDIDHIGIQWQKRSCNVKINLETALLDYSG